MPIWRVKPPEGAHTSPRARGSLRRCPPPPRSFPRPVAAGRRAVEAIPESPLYIGRVEILPEVVDQSVAELQHVMVAVAVGPAVREDHVTHCFHADLVAFRHRVENGEPRRAVPALGLVGNFADPLVGCP